MDNHQSRKEKEYSLVSTVFGWDTLFNDKFVDENSWFDEVHSEVETKLKTLSKYISENLRIFGVNQERKVLNDSDFYEGIISFYLTRKIQEEYNSKSEKIIGIIETIKDLYDRIQPKLKFVLKGDQRKFIVLYQGKLLPGLPEDENIINEILLDTKKEKLFHLVREGKVSELEQFLEAYPEEINELKDKNLNTALHIASQLADPKIIQILLSKGASPTERNYYKNTPLHLLGFELPGEEVADKSKSFIEIANKLLHNNQDLVNSLNRSNQSPLFFAADLCYEELFHYLVSKGAEDIQDTKISAKPSELLQKRKKESRKQNIVHLFEELILAREHNSNNKLIEIMKEIFTDLEISPHKDIWNDIQSSWDKKLDIQGSKLMPIKTDYVADIPTEGHGDCFYHAIDGEPQEGLYRRDDVSNVRKLFIQTIKCHLEDSKNKQATITILSNFLNALVNRKYENNQAELNQVYANYQGTLQNLIETNQNDDDTYFKKTQSIIEDFCDKLRKNPKFSRIFNEIVVLAIVRAIKNFIIDGGENNFRINFEEIVERLKDSKAEYYFIKKLVQNKNDSIFENDKFEFIDDELRNQWKLLKVSINDSNINSHLNEDYIKTVENLKGQRLKELIDIVCEFYATPSVFTDETFYYFWALTKSIDIFVYRDRNFKIFHYSKNGAFKELNEEEYKDIDNKDSALHITNIVGAHFEKLTNKPTSKSLQVKTERTQVSSEECRVISIHSSNKRSPIHVTTEDGGYALNTIPSSWRLSTNLKNGSQGQHISAYILILESINYCLNKKLEQLPEKLCEMGIKFFPTEAKFEKMKEKTIKSFEEIRQTRDGMRKLQNTIGKNEANSLFDKNDMHLKNSQDQIIFSYIQEFAEHFIQLLNQQPDMVCKPERKVSLQMQFKYMILEIENDFVSRNNDFTSMVEVLHEAKDKIKLTSLTNEFFEEIANKIQASRPQLNPTDIANYLRYKTPAVKESQSSAMAELRKFVPKENLIDQEKGCVSFAIYKLFDYPCIPDALDSSQNDFSILCKNLARHMMLIFMAFQNLASLKFEDKTTIFKGFLCFILNKQLWKYYKFKNASNQYVQVDIDVILNNIKNYAILDFQNDIYKLL